MLTLFRSLLVLLLQPRSPTRVVLVASLSFGVPLCISAQSAVLEEVIVTAQKREQSLQDVPISVHAVSGSSIQNQGIDRLEDLSATLPNITVSQTATSDQLFIRGIGSGGNTGFEQSVGTFIDGVYFGRDVQSRGRFFDVERVEVLRGPQSIYFGNNTIGGAINITTARPTDEFEGYVTALYEPDHGEHMASAAVSGPIHETLLARLAIQHSGMDGYVTNIGPDGGDGPDTTNRMGRVTAIWTPTDAFGATLKAEVGSFEDRGRSLQMDQCPPPPPLTLGPICALGLGPGIGLGFDGSGLNETRSIGNVGGLAPLGTSPDGSKLNTHLFQLTANYELSNHTLTSVTAFSDYDLSRTIDMDVSPFFFFNFIDDHEYEQWSQELRITSPTGERFEYLAGLYYENSDLRILEHVALGGPFQTTQFTDFEQDAENSAFFGALTWNITSSLSASAGLRFTKVDKELVRSLQLLNVVTLEPNFPIGVQAPPPFASIPHIGLETSRSDDDLTPSFNVQYDFNENMMFYASYAEGFKAGGFDQRAATPDPNDITFEPEQVDAYEVGAKTTWFDGAMNLNIALFRSEYEDLQVSVFTGQGIVFFIDNAASSITQGVEVELRWALTNQLTLNFSGSFLDAYYDEFPEGPCSTLDNISGRGNCPVSRDFADENLTYAPEFSGLFTLEHMLPVTNALQLTTRIDLIFSDDFDVVSDNDPRVRQEGYTKLNARVGFGPADGTWELAVVGKNLTNEFTSHFGNDLPANPTSLFRFFDRPRSIALQARYAW
jgi:outer membrane receptor protein involved in Fe transport